MMTTSTTPTIGSSCCSFISISDCDSTRRQRQQQRPSPFSLRQRLFPYQQQQQQQQVQLLRLQQQQQHAWYLSSTLASLPSKEASYKKKKRNPNDDDDNDDDDDYNVAKEEDPEENERKQLLKEGGDLRAEQPIPADVVYHNDRQELAALSKGLLSPNPDDDPCPEWQNPLHHRNPNLEKVFPEDFPDGIIPPEAYIAAPPVTNVDGSGIYAPQNVIDICNNMLQLNMLKMATLHQKICQHFDFPYDEPMPMGGGGVGTGGGGGSTAGAAAEVEVEAAPARTKFDLKLVGYDEKAKIKVIKEVRAICSLGLKEAREMVEGAPKIISKDLKPELAEELKQKLQDAGAIVEIV